MLPARMVLAHDAEAGTYRTWVESIALIGETKIHYGRVFDTEAEAVENYRKRAGGCEFCEDEIRS